MTTHTFKTHYDIGDRFLFWLKYKEDEKAEYVITDISHHEFTRDGEHRMDETTFTLRNMSENLWYIFPIEFRITDERLHGIICEKSSLEKRGYRYGIRQLGENSESSE